MLGTGRPTVLHAPKATRASSYKSTSPPASPPKPAAVPKKELRPLPGYAGHLMNMHDVGVGQTFGEGSKQTLGATAAALSASAADLPADSLDDRARAASDRVEIGGLPVGDDPRRKNPAVSAPHLYPEFEANLRLRHGPGALEVCVRAPFGVDDLSPKSGPPDSPGSMYETSAMRGPGRWAREP